MCHVMKARMLGAGTIVAVDRSRFRLGLARELGADHALNVDDLDARSRVAAIRDLTHGRGADVVVECAGVPQAVPEGLEMLRPGGMLVEVGNFSDLGTVPLSPHLICSKNLRIVGVGGEAITAYGPSLDALRRYRRHYPLEKFVTHRYPIEEADAAVRASMADDVLKVVITP
jgi:threonine dehydrogenase-like Zn-dependent dehydrogenase